jgi:NDP-sugar pyrophosphorylase family protein
VPLLNVPFLAYQLDLLCRHGVTDVVLSCSYRVDDVRRAMGDGSAWGVSLRYAVEDEPLGTGGGVRNAVHLVAGQLVLVLNGDVLTDADLSAMLRFHRDRQAAATIDLFPVPDPTPFGLVELGEAGRVTRFSEKPNPAEITTNTINAGIYLLDARLLERIPTGRAVSIEREFFPGLLADRVPFYGWVGDHYWLDIGNPAKYRQAQVDLMAGRLATGVATPAGADGRQIAADARVDPAAVISGPSVIGAGCRLDAGCHVGPRAVLGARCHVGRGAQVSDAILWDGVSVGEGAELRDAIAASDVEIGEGAVVGPGAVLAAGTVVPARAHVDS